MSIYLDGLMAVEYGMLDLDLIIYVKNNFFDLNKIDTIFSEKNF